MEGREGWDGGLLWEDGIVMGSGDEDSVLTTEVATTRMRMRMRNRV
jgi:hypothetical protein